MHLHLSERSKILSQIHPKQRHNNPSLQSTLECAIIFGEIGAITPPRANNEPTHGSTIQIARQSSSKKGKIIAVCVHNNAVQVFHLLLECKREQKHFFPRSEYTRQDILCKTLLIIPVDMSYKKLLFLLMAQPCFVSSGQYVHGWMQWKKKKRKDEGCLVEFFSYFFFFLQRTWFLQLHFDHPASLCVYVSTYVSTIRVHSMMQVLNELSRVSRSILPGMAFLLCHFCLGRGFFLLINIWLPWQLVLYMCFNQQHTTHITKYRLSYTILKRYNIVVRIPIKTDTYFW